MGDPERKPKKEAEEAEAAERKRKEEEEAARKRREEDNAAGQLVGETQSPTPFHFRWEEDVTHCRICSRNLGKRYLRPRRHCRSCGRAVCDDCSPHLVSVAGWSGLQRVCNQCNQ